MSLSHPFRHIPHHGGPAVPAVPTAVVPMSFVPPSDHPAAPHAEGSAGPTLTCRWEVADEQEVHHGGQTFRTGDMFLHWMPVH
jgi:hypothetical protein